MGSYILVFLAVVAVLGMAVAAWRENHK